MQLYNYLPNKIFRTLRVLVQKLRGVSISWSSVLFFGVNIERFPENVDIGERVIVKSGARLCPCNLNARIRIGSRTTIGYSTYIFASDRIYIGDDCMIASFVYLVDSQHNSDDPSQPMNLQGASFDPILVGHDVWIGTGSVIMPGVSIGDGAIIGANSVVTSDVPPRHIVAGNPARFIRKRGSV